MTPPRNERAIHFQVTGRARPQGSMSFNSLTQRMYPAAKGLKAWKDVVAGYGMQALSTTDIRFVQDEPLAVGLTFVYSRPGTHFRKSKGERILDKDAPVMKTTVPDLDKLVRAMLDGLVLGKVMPDDRQVVSLQAEKVFGTADYVEVLIRAPRWAA